MAKQPEGVTVALNFADGTVGVMTVITTEYSADGSVRWSRQATPALIEEEIGRASASFAPEKVPVAGWTPVNVTDIPADRTFRNALRHDGKAFSHCPIHAKEIALAKVRAHRTPRFAELDAKRMAAGRKGDRYLAARLDAEADALANLTDPVKACTTVEELKKALLTLGVE